MIDWGSVPDWLSVALAFIALMAFVIVERDRLILRPRIPGKKGEPGSSVSLEDKEQFKPTENDVAIRAELYGRILLGIVLGVALSPICTGLSSVLLRNGTSDPYAFYETVKTTIAVLLAFLLSLLLTFVYFRAYSGWTSVFVHWVERFAISFFGFSVLVLFSYPHYTTGYTKMDFLTVDTLVAVTVGIVLFLLIGFPSTPIDWIIRLVSKQKEVKKT